MQNNFSLKTAIIAHYGEDFYKSRLDFINFLEEKKCESISFVPDDNYREKIVKTGKRVFFYSYKRNWKFIFSVLKTYYFFVSSFKKEKPQILFTYKFFPNIVGILAGKKAKINKIVATIAGIGFLEKRNENFVINIIFKIYMWILNKAHIIITQNAEDFQLLKENLEKPKIILTHGSGINPSNFNNFKLDKAQFCIENGLDSTKRYITFCSRIVSQKGIKELIIAYNNISDLTYQYDLIVAGWFDEKNLEQEAVKLMRKNSKIHYIGYQKDVVNVLSISDAIILPSYYPEGVPRSLTEALAQSKVIITTDHKGCRETCLDGKNGFLVEPRSIKSIEDALLKFNKLKSEELFSFKKNSLALFDSKFSSDIVYKTIWNGINN